MRRVGGIGCLVPRSGPNLALFESCGAMDGESCAGTPGHLWSSIHLSNLTVVGLYTRYGFVTNVIHQRVIKEIYES